MLYLKAVSDSCQALPDPGKLANNLKAFVFRFLKTPPGALEIPPDLDTQRLFPQNVDRNGGQQRIFQRKYGFSFLFVFLKAPTGRGLTEPVCLPYHFCFYNSIWVREREK